MKLEPCCANFIQILEVPFFPVFFVEIIAICVRLPEVALSSFKAQ